MAITTLDGAIAGMQAPQPFMKVGVTMAAVAAQRASKGAYVAIIQFQATLILAVWLSTRL